VRNNEDRLGSLLTNQDSSVIPQVSAQLNFVVPTEYVDLPSKGKLYSVGHPLHGKTSVEIKQMTAKEEDILTSESYIKKGIVLEKLLESIIVDKNIKPEFLTVSDRSAIFLSARILAYGPNYNIIVNCPNCASAKTLDYNLIDGPKVTSVKDDLEITERGTFFITLPQTGWNVECRSMFGKDELSIPADKNKALDNQVSKQLLSIIVSINGSENKEILSEALGVLPAKDSRYLRIKYKELMPEVKFSMDFKCPCDYSGEVDVPITLEFFWPK
jgi:hypothetical protein